jgi:hypothetical protein
VTDFHAFFRRCCLAALLLAPDWAAAADYPPDSGWSTFWGAVVDEILGPPGEAALRETAVFAQAGIRFEYPALLRVNHDAEQQQWRLWRGDAELAVHTGDYDAQHARRLLETMQGIMHNDSAGAAEPLAEAAALNWCGREVSGLRMRLNFLGDHHEYLAYDLQLANGESRLLIFEDVLDKGANSVTQKALLATVSRSLTCTGG